MPATTGRETRAPHRFERWMPRRAGWRSFRTAQATLYSSESGCLAESLKDFRDEAFKNHEPSGLGRMYGVACMKGKFRVFMSIVALMVLAAGPAAGADPSDPDA